MDVEVDRLSSLPDDLIYKILSYVDIVYCVRSSVLSSRWRFIWTSMPSLNFALPSLNFARREWRNSSSLYHEFVNNVLSGRNNKIDVSSVSVNLARAVDISELSVERILEYAFSHNIQQLTMIGTHVIDCHFHYPRDLPALTTLHLHDASLDNFSSILAMCHNLKNLTLERCRVFECGDSDGSFTIINPRLLSLTLKKVEWFTGFVRVDTPELKSFIFVDAPPQEFGYTADTNQLVRGLTISARDLTYLRIKGFYFPKLSLDGCPSVEKVDLCISSPQKTDVHRIRDLFLHLHSVKSLALNLEIAELLSTLEEVVSHQPSPFPSLKSLKIYPLQGLKTWRYLGNCQIKSSLEIFQTQLDEEQEETDEEQEAMEIKLSAEVTNYLLGSSSNATFTMVSYEEARAIKITKVAHRLTADLWKILEKKEAFTETKRANVEWKKTLADTCFKDFKMKISLGIDAEEIFYILQNIKILLTKVIASKRVEMQARFSRLSAKSKTVVNKLVVDMKNQCDIKQRTLSGYFDEITLSS